MIRRDYLMRLVQEMGQVLIRVVSLKHQKNYEEAIREIGAALKHFREGKADGEADHSLENWIALCERHDQAGAAMIMAVADLIKEQGDILALQNRSQESQQSHALALGLLLEGILNRGAFISGELIEKVDDLFQQTRRGELERALLRRLFDYFVTRGLFA